MTSDYLHARAFKSSSSIRDSATPRRMTRIVRADEDIGRGGRIGLLRVALEGGQHPLAGFGGTATQGRRGEEDVHGQVEGEPVAQQERTMQQQEATGRELDVGTAG